MRSSWLVCALLLSFGMSLSGSAYAQRIAKQEAMEQRIQRVREDLQGLGRFYNVEFSKERQDRFRRYYADELKDLQAVAFDKLDRSGQIDYLLLQNFLETQTRKLEMSAKANEKTLPLLPFAPTILKLWEDRQKMLPIDGEACAADMNKVAKDVAELRAKIEGGLKIDPPVAFRAARNVDRLRDQMSRWFNFYKGYDPMFSWWVAEPYQKTNKALEDLSPYIREKLVGLKPGDKDTIVGEPIGREALMVELEAEKIVYTPEELIAIGESEYAWCEKEMKKASRELGFGDDWHKALEHVKKQHVEPGKQPQLIRDLALEAIDYVKSNDLVTVPPLAEETWRMEMMSPERQRVSPFFLGGESILVSFPTDTMDHSAKLMSMRGNNIHFARATVHHELIPGHHLQGFMNARFKPYREMFDTPFWIEGWALYWEMILWDKGFPKTPENKIGMLFWRMHRCARIVFSLKFHLGQMTPAECVDFLVDKVGHERSTAEGEVRRSFGGDYSPLYQAAYMLGAIQIYSLRKDLVDGGKVPEKAFHDRILQENQMPIELLRALMKDQALTRNFKASWRFYEKS